nr:MAG TPA: hypothetical protein [Caudoviricetes sp.]
MSLIFHLFVFQNSHQFPLLLITSTSKLLFTIVPISII